MIWILYGQVVSREKDWKYWCDTEFPEEEDIPSGLEKGLSIFRKLLLIRSWCPDRTLSQARKYIADSLGLEFLENKVSVHHRGLEKMIDTLYDHVIDIITNRFPVENNNTKFE